MTITSGATPPGRVHVTNPRDWGMSAGTDYWASFGDLTLAPALAQDLVNYGWLEAGTWAQLAGSAAGLNDSADAGTTGGANFPAADDSIVSPFIFGDYSHALLAGAFLGYTPTTLNMECYARFAAENDEESSGFGFVEAGATTTFIKGDLMALVTTDGTDFSLENGTAAAAGSTDNTTPPQVQDRSYFGRYHQLVYRRHQAGQQPRHSSEPLACRVLHHHSHGWVERPRSGLGSHLV